MVVGWYKQHEKYWHLLIFFLYNIIIKKRMSSKEIFEINARIKRDRHVSQCSLSDNIRL